jgi:AcrR family transcriptional regulator
MNVHSSVAAKVTEARVEARRGQILEAASVCFSRKGFHQTTMQDISREAGLSPGALYSYFESKEDIVSASGEQALGTIASLIQEVKAESHHPMQALALLGQFIYQHMLSTEKVADAQLNLEIYSEMSRSERLRTSVRDQIRLWRQSMAELIGEAQRTQAIASDMDPEGVAMTAIVLLEGLWLCNVLAPGEIDPSKVLSLMRQLTGIDPKTAFPGQPIVPIVPPESKAG